MFPIIGALVLGAVLMGRTKARTSHSKKTVLGARSGLTYSVEEFPDAGFLVVRAHDGSTGVFSRAGLSQRKGEPSTGFIWHHGRGHPQTMRAMMLDFNTQQQTPERVQGSP